jgi:hypothetical protein
MNRKEMVKTKGKIDETNKPSLRKTVTIGGMLEFSILTTN